MNKKLGLLSLSLCGVLLMGLMNGCGKVDSKAVSPTSTPKPTETTAPEAAVMPTPEPKRKIHRSGDYSYVLLEDHTAEITGFPGYQGRSKELIIPTELGGYAVTGIGDIAFAGCLLTSVTIPESVTRIGANPFAGCSELISITVSPDHPTLECIDGVLFSKPDKRLVCYPCTFTAEEYSIPQGVLAIGHLAFAGCSGLNNVTISESVTSIGNNAFSGCNLTSVTIPDSVSRIGANPFEFCGSLSNITVSPDHPALECIDGVLFSKPDKRLVCYPCTFTAEEYSIPQGVLAIGDSAFATCRSLNNVAIPDSVTSMGDLAFEYCSLTSVTIPNSVTNIGANPFSWCRINSIEVSPDHPTLECIDGVLFSKPDKRLVCYPYTFTAEEYSIPQGILLIGDYAFESCDLLQSVVIPESVTSIGDYAFHYCCNLQSVTIPEGVTSIGGFAFLYCSNLQSVAIPDTVISIGDFAFYLVSQGVTTITVGRDSYAKQYCVDNGLNYIYFDQND